MKTCFVCQIPKEPTEYRYQSKTCIECRDSYHKRYYQKHKEKIIKRANDSIKNNPERHKEYCKTSRKKNCAKAKEYRQKRKRENPDLVNQHSLKYYYNNKEKCRARYNNKLKTDINFLLKVKLRHRMRSALHGIDKSKRTVEILGCSIEDFRAHLESKFDKRMSWESYGYRGWHIDHIRPCASFDLTNPDEQAACFHYTNMQPLWCTDNFKKSAKYEPNVHRKGL